MMQCENEYGFSIESDVYQLLHNSTMNVEKRGCLSTPVKHSLVLDGEKGELVKACGRVGKRKGVSGTKTEEALRSHSEAERRRRERINAHLESLRELVPNNEKMDKATLLAEVVSQIKQLRETASLASEGLHIPMDTDEVRVERVENHSGDGSFLLMASLCCEHWPDLLSDVRQVMKRLPVQVVKSEVSTLGSRVKIAFLITSVEGDDGVVGLVRAALSDIVEKVSALAESAEQLFISRKRQRGSCIDSSSNLLE
ncbi:transcription factor bHLH30-like isoform X2 [Salvia hispanica]|uniref:transcription factor bHLH30-like isoform X2 n=1 Tax=Salvia hispanica TaxID=49212 RepID=UPI0020090FED|nr:transcription factor bHLH30-like isoform X2 [Salvia hispanica]